MIHSRLVKRGVTAGAGVVVGACAGIAGSAAAPAKSPASGGSPKARQAAVTLATEVGPAPRGVVAFKVGFGGAPVHGVLTVPNKAGDGFDTVTEDSGTVKSVSGDQLTVTEGTDKATFATPTLTIAPGATVQRNFQDAKLADVQPGDHVDVSASSDGTQTVFAIDPQQWPPKPPTGAGCGKAGALPLPGAMARTVSGGAGEITTSAVTAVTAAAPAAPPAGGGQSAIVTAAAPGGPTGGIVCIYKAP